MRKTDSKGVRKGEDVLRQGMGITGTRQGGGNLQPKGIPESSEAAELTVEDFAMVTVMASTEGIEPTYEEARRQSDWPRWREAIQVKLNNLKNSGTWKLVKRPPDTNVVDC